MLDYGIIHSSSTGMFHYLPLGLRILEKLVRLIDNEMSRIGAQKIEMPCMIPKQLLQNTGKYSSSNNYHYFFTDLLIMENEFSLFSLRKMGCMGTIPF